MPSARKLRCCRGRAASNYEAILYRPDKTRMRSNDRFILRFVFWSFALAVALTALHHVHEDLPRIVRAPTSLLLAPVAAVDGLCYVLGLRGIYRSTAAVFVVNLVFSFLLAAAVAAALRWRRGRSA